jgi:hypothetical protein
LGRIERYLKQSLPRIKLAGLEPKKVEPILASKNKKAKSNRKPDKRLTNKTGKKGKKKTASKKNSSSKKTS